MNFCSKAKTISSGLYGTFQDATSDYRGRLVIAMEIGAQPEAVSETDYLLAANATRSGNLDYRISPENPEPILKLLHKKALSCISDYIL